MGHIRKCAVASILVLTASFHAADGFARTWYIRPGGDGDAPTIQAGIDSATAGDDVLVAAGSYTWASQGMATDLYGPTMIEVHPDIRLHSEAGAVVTVLDAEQQGRVLVCRFCTGIEGFTITGGRTLREPNGGSYAGTGGGIFVVGGQPVLADNIVRSNFAGGAGGGIATHGGRTPGSAPVIRWNSILWNVAGYRTGGIEVGGSVAAVVENNTVVGNSGGGVACIDCGGTIARNVIAESAPSSSGLVGGFGMFCLAFDGDAPPTVSCNILWDNSGGDAVCGTDGGGNLIEDPRFCASDPEGTGRRFVRADSPALPQNNSCGVPIGATGEDCEVTDRRETPGGARATLSMAPNPMRDRLTIDYGVPFPTRLARLGVYDLRGRVVAHIPALPRSASGSITWDGRDATGVAAGAGVYIVRLQTDRGAVTRKLVITR